MLASTPRGQNRVPAVSAVVPTLNPGGHAARLRDAILRQTLQPVDVIILDSESEDASVAVFREAGFQVERVERATFNHGRVRNRGAALAQGDIIIYLSQDAEPADPHCFERLVAPIALNAADAAFARQLPRPDATPLEHFARSRNYPPTGRIVQAADVSSMGLMAYFFSDACSAVRRRTLLELGGLPDHVVTNEDMLFAARLLGSGGRVAYVADALVLHSHRLGPVATLRRYFDIGAFFTQAGDELALDGLTSSGMAYARALFGSLVRQRRWDWLIPAALETAAKWFGQRLGRLHASLPAGLVQRLSGHPAFWSRGAPR